MRIGDRVIESGAPPYVIAEIGVNHGGSRKRAEALVQAAAAAGADAVKLQMFDADRLASRAAPLARYQEASGADDQRVMLRALQLGADDLSHLAGQARRHGLHAIVSVFTVELIEAAERAGWDAYKVASSDATHRPLIEALMNTGRPIIASTGAATLDEVRRLTSWLGDYPHTLMHCVCAYPTPEDRASLAGRQAMLEVDPRALGYSDHTTAVDSGALAVASGAVLLEKHFTDDRSAKGPDHAFSLDPDGFRRYVELAHRAARMLGPRAKQVSEIEHDVRRVARQSVVAARRLPAEHVLSAADLTIKRPGTGLPPWRLGELIGRRTSCAVEADQPIGEEDLA